MSNHGDLPLQIQRNVSLEPYNTFQIPARAKYYLPIHQLDQLQQLYASGAFEQKYFILGGGSNILLAADFDGLVLHNHLSGITQHSKTADSIFIEVASGERWHDFVMYCIDHGWGGLENLSLIPGTVGAAPMQNIGAYGVELNDHFHSLRAFNLQTATVETFYEQECEFAYRQSIFKTHRKNQFFILSVTFKLSRQPRLNFEYGAIKEALHQLQPAKLSIKAVSDAVIHIRRTKLPDPRSIANAGSFFKNPVITPKAFADLLTKYPNIPYFKLANQQVKIPAGWLIEHCGWKGKMVDGVGTHHQQALVLVKNSSGTAQSLLQLATQIEQDVLQKFSIRLEREVNVIE